MLRLFPVTRHLPPKLLSIMSYCVKARALATVASAHSGRARHRCGESLLSTWMGHATFQKVVISFLRCVKMSP